MHEHHQSKPPTGPDPPAPITALSCPCAGHPSALPPSLLGVPFSQSTDEPAKQVLSQGKVRLELGPACNFWKTPGSLFCRHSELHADGWRSAWGRATAQLNSNPSKQTVFYITVTNARKQMSALFGTKISFNLGVASSPFEKTTCFQANTTHVFKQTCHANY